MLADGWTLADGRQAELWLETSDDEDQPFTLGWIRSVIRRS
jgi:hypothetical protein